MNIKTAVSTCYRDKYIDVSSRAMRSEFWWFLLAFLVIWQVLALIDAAAFAPIYTLTMQSPVMPEGIPVDFGPMSTIFLIVSIIPLITVTMRRLHDTGKSGWWLLLTFVPVIGFLVVFVFAAMKGTEGPNRFGPNPLGPVALREEPEDMPTEIPPTA